MSSGQKSRSGNVLVHPRRDTSRGRPPTGAGHASSRDSGLLTTPTDADIRLLNVFRTIVRCRGFAPAQAELNSSQSTISTQIAALEAKLGVRLCERGRSGFMLTEEGESIYTATNELFAAIEDFRIKAAESRHCLAGELRLGIVDAIATNASCNISAAIAKFKERSSEVNIKLSVAPPTDLETAILDGRLHLAISFFPHRLPTLTYEPAFVEDQILHCGAKHPLFAEDDEQQLLDKLPSCDYVDRSYMEDPFAAQALAFQRDKCSALNMEAIAILILSGKFVGYLPTHYGHYWVARGEMRTLVPHVSVHRTEFHLIADRNHRLPKIARAFLQDFRSTRETF